LGKVIELKLISEKEKCFRESQSIKHPQPISYKEWNKDKGFILHNEYKLHVRMRRCCIKLKNRKLHFNTRRLYFIIFLYLNSNITEMLEICIQTSYDQNVQLILKSYLPVVYGTTLRTPNFILSKTNQITIYSIYSSLNGQ
jgi:hypothetical protein